MFGDVMKTGSRRSLRMPVAASTVSARCTFSSLFFRLTTFRSWRRPSASGRDTRPAAFNSRLRSASGMSASRDRSETIFSSRSAAARNRAASESLSVSPASERWDALLVGMHSIYPLRLPQRTFAPRNLSGQRRHIDHKPVTYVALQHALVSLVDGRNVDHLDVGSDTVLRAVVQHLLRFGNAADP